MSHAATYAKLAATMLFWGGTWIAARVVVQEVAPLAAAVWRFLFATLALLALVAWRHRGLPRLARADWPLVLGLAATGIFLYNLCFLYGLQHIGAGRGALVVALTPAVTALAAWPLLGERMTALKAAGSVVALLGCLVVIGHGSPLAPLAGDIGLGELLILGCVVLWSAYTLIGRRAMHRLSPLVATAYASAAGGLMLAATAAVVAPAALVPAYPAEAWAAILFLGLLGTAVGFTWFIEAVARIGAARASIFINFVPVAAVLLAALILGERLEVAVLAGGALILGGVVLTQRPAGATP